MLPLGENRRCNQIERSIARSEALLTLLSVFPGGVDAGCLFWSICGRFRPKQKIENQHRAECLRVTFIV